MKGDVIGISAMVLASTLPLSCLPAERPENLQPFVAAAGSYSLAAPPESSGVCSTCGSKVPPGGGRLGDGTVSVPCPECNKAALSTDCSRCGGDGLYEADDHLYICRCRR